MIYIWQLKKLTVKTYAVNKKSVKNIRGHLSSIKNFGLFDQYKYYFYPSNNYVIQLLPHRLFEESRSIF